MSIEALPPRAQAAIAGVGYTEYTRDSGVTVATLAVDACRASAADCGLAVDEIDGIVSYSFFGDSVASSAVATALALPELHYSLDLGMGGQAPCLAVMQAAMAVKCGMARNILVYRALNGRSGYRVGRETYRTPTSQYRYPFGVTAYAHLTALWAQRYLNSTGAKRTDLGEVVIAQRKYAAINERAMRRRPVDMESYLEQTYFVDPFRPSDCTIEVDGACAVLVTSYEHALDLRHRPAVIDGGAWISLSRPGYDVADTLMAGDMTSNFTSGLADRLWSSASRSVDEVAFAEIYDCFSSTVLFGLEGLGFAGRGEAGAFIASGATSIDGALPVNTNGGMLAEGYLQGMNTVAEAVLQIQKRAGSRQIPHPEVAVVTSGALTDGSAMVLSNGER